MQVFYQDLCTLWTEKWERMKKVKGNREGSEKEREDRQVQHPLIIYWIMTLSKCSLAFEWIAILSNWMNESGNMSPFLYKKLKAWKGFKNWHKGTIVESALVSSLSVQFKFSFHLHLLWAWAILGLHSCQFTRRRGLMAEYKSALYILGQENFSMWKRNIP